MEIDMGVTQGREVESADEATRRIMAPMPDVNALDNPMWDALRDHAKPSAYDWDGGAFQVGGIGDWLPLERRSDLVGRYAWTITDPATVAFVARHTGPKVIDPMAGSGYWAHLLRQLGVDVLASDETPPTGEANNWHRTGVQHVEVGRADAVEAVAAHGADRALLLAWPPYDSPIGADTLAAFPGDRVIFIGESEGGCTGDDRLFALFAEEWTEVASHRPVQFMGLHDFITVYDRKA
jgi:hypothetical protein